MQLQNPISGLMVEAKSCAGCGRPFAPHYGEFPTSVNFCSACIANGTAFRGTPAPDQRAVRLSILEGQQQILIADHQRTAEHYGYESRQERQAWLGVENITRQIKALKEETR